jgi:hypothetical protein
VLDACASYWVPLGLKGSNSSATATNSSANSTPNKSGSSSSSSGGSSSSSSSISSSSGGISGSSGNTSNILGLVMTNLNSYGEGYHPDMPLISEASLGKLHLSLVFLLFL